MKNLDYLGNELQLDDDVVFINPFMRKLTTGTIVKITPKKVLVKYLFLDQSLIDKTGKCTDKEYKTHYCDKDKVVRA